MDELSVTKISEIITNEIKFLNEYNFEDKTLPVDDFQEYYNKENKRNRYHCTHGWFIRCSWVRKVNILKRLAWVTNNLYTNIHIMNTIYTATCKDWIYSSYQGLNLFKCDVILNDHDRCMDTEILEHVIDDLVLWYRSIDDVEQYSLIMDMMQLSDSCIIGKIFYEYLIIFKKRFREVIIDKIKEENKLAKELEENDNKAKKKVKGEKKPKKGKKAKELTEEELEIERERQRQKEIEEISKQKQLELEEIMKFLNEKFPEDSVDPDAIGLVNLLKNWNSFIVAYNKKVGIGVVVKKPNKKDKAGKKDKGAKKDKGKKKEKVNKDLPDDIQLLPIWINKPLIASIDAKTFKNVKKVNKYWNFIVKGIKQDVKCRQALNKSCAKLKSGLKICNFEKTIPDHQLAPRFTRISNVTDDVHRKFIESSYNAKTTFTLLADLYKTGTIFNVCATSLEIFPRFTYAYKLDRIGQ